MIEVKNLVKKYGSHVAVNKLSFTVEKGKIYGFLGPNGAGKSTTMNIMTGYIGASEGDVLINGHSISNEPEVAKKYIGYLPEIPPLYTDMLVKEYIGFAAELKKIPAKNRKTAIDEAIDMAKLNNVKNRLIRNLSKGYKQRVGLAQAILGMPEIIILDEPTVGLDPKQIIEIREVIKELSKKHTIILSSHIMQEVSAVCDYIMIISNGKMVASDTPENLEKIMAGENTLELTVRGEKSRVSKILDNIKCKNKIKSIQINTSENNENKSEQEIVIVSDKDVDIREDVFFAFAAEKCPVISMNMKTVSLEDVFLKLTSEPEDTKPDNNEPEDTKPDTKEPENTLSENEESNNEEKEKPVDNEKEEEN